MNGGRQSERGESLRLYTTNLKALVGKNGGSEAKRQKWRARDGGYND